MIRLTRGFKKAAAGTAGLVLGLTGFAPIAAAENSGPVLHRAQNEETYHAELQPLNGSGVTGNAVLVHEDNVLGVSIEAEGLVPNQVHPQHIHGKNHPEVALCPTPDADANNDGFLSVIEGAPDYGPIKLNLTDPQTPFGAPPTDALFFPFAGTPDNNNFPTADADGNVSFEGSFTFDMSNPDAAAAHASLMPLTDQHIVLHGAMAPASVDAPAFEALGLPVSEDLNAVIYDPLLPVACGEIKALEQNENGNAVVETPTEEAPVTTPNEGAAGQPETPAAQPVRQTTEGQDAVAAFEAAITVNLTRFEQSLEVAQATFERELEEGVEPAVARDRFIATVQAARDLHVRDFFEARNAAIDQLNRSGQTALRDQVMAEHEAELQEFTRTFEELKSEVNEAVNNHNRS